MSSSQRLCGLPFGLFPTGQYWLDHECFSLVIAGATQVNQRTIIQRRFLKCVNGETYTVHKMYKYCTVQFYGDSCHVLISST